MSYFFHYGKFPLLHWSMTLPEHHTTILQWSSYACSMFWSCHSLKNTSWIHITPWTGTASHSSLVVGCLSTEWHSFAPSLSLMGCILQEFSFSSCKQDATFSYTRLLTAHIQLTTQWTAWYDKLWWRNQFVSYPIQLQLFSTMAHTLPMSHTALRHEVLSTIRQTDSSKPR